MIWNWNITEKGQLGRTAEALARLNDWAINSNLHPEYCEQVWLLFLKGYSRTGKPEKGNRANQRQGMASTSRKTMHTRTLRFREDRVERVNEKTLKAWVVQAGWIRNKQGQQMKSVSGKFHTEEGRGSLYIAELLKSLWNAPAVAKHIHGFRQEKCTKVTK